MREEDIVLTTDCGKVVKVWVHRKSGWKWSEDALCYIYGDFHQPPSKYCYGERMICCVDGRDSFGVLWIGSTPNGWHDWDFGADLTTALQWVRDCKYPELGVQVWGALEVPKNIIGSAEL